MTPLRYCNNFQISPKNVQQIMTTRNPEPWVKSSVKMSHLSTMWAFTQKLTLAKLMSVQCPNCQWKFWKILPAGPRNQKNLASKPNFNRNAIIVTNVKFLTKLIQPNWCAWYSNSLQNFKKTKRHCVFVSNLGKHFSTNYELLIQCIYGATKAWKISS